MTTLFPEDGAQRGHGPGRAAAACAPVCTCRARVQLLHPEHASESPASGKPSDGRSARGKCCGDTAGCEHRPTRHRWIWSQGRRDRQKSTDAVTGSALVLPSPGLQGFFLSEPQHLKCTTLSCCQSNHFSQGTSKSFQLKVRWITMSLTFL